MQSTDMVVTTRSFADATQMFTFRVVANYFLKNSAKFCDGFRSGVLLGCRALLGCGRKCRFLNSGEWPLPEDLL